MLLLGGALAVSLRLKLEVDEEPVRVELLPVVSGLLDEVVLVLDDAHYLLLECSVAGRNNVLRDVPLRHIRGCESVGELIAGCLLG